MSALTETGAKLTEFSGQIKVFTAKIGGGIGTAGTLTVEEFSTIISVQTTMAEKPDADCAQIYINTVSGNVITPGSVEDDMTTENTQNPHDYYITVIGY